MISFTSDWLFPTSESRAIVHALNAGGARVSFAEIVTDKGHDAFLLDEPELFAIVRGFLEGAARARGLPGAATMMLSRLKRDLTMAEAARTPGGARVDLLVVADMVEPGAKVLDVGCGDGELLRLLGETRNVDGRGIELSREGVNEGVAKGLAVIQGDADTDLVGLSRRRLRLRDPVADACRRRASRASCSSTCCASAGTRSCRSRISATGGSGCRSCSAATCRAPTTCRMRGRTSPNIHFCTIKDFRELCDVVGAKMEQAGRAQRLGRADPAQRAVVVLESVRRAGGVPAQPQDGTDALTRR